MSDGISKLTYQLEQHRQQLSVDDEVRMFDDLALDPPEKKKSRSHRKVLNGVTPISPTNSSTTSMSQEFYREQPIIHNKLYCDQVANAIKPQRRVSQKVLSKLGNDDLRSVKSHTELAETANGVRMLAKNLLRATIQLDVRAIMVVTKARDNSLIYLTREVVEWFFACTTDIVIYIDLNLRTSKRFDLASLAAKYPSKAHLVQFWDKKVVFKHPEKFDLVLTLGGDGTVLHVSNLFQRVVPPVISFALGSLGFLTNFEFHQFREKMQLVIDSGVRAYLRMRFTCRVHKGNGKLVCEQQVLNELVVDRGPSPFVTNLELYGDGSLLTVAQADGLIIATPTGSTAYSLSAGGSLVHPGVSAISVTPICPHTLSFRPILLPDGMFLKVKVPESSRSTAWCSFDGKVRTELCKGDYVTIQASPYPFPTVISSKTEYIDSVSRNLHWNVRETQKPLGHLMKNDDEGSDFDINYDDDAKSLSSASDAEYDLEAEPYYDDDEKFLPSPGDGLNTPPPPSVMSPFGGNDDRACYAHPNATISLDASRMRPRYPSSVSTTLEPSISRQISLNIE